MFNYKLANWDQKLYKTIPATTFSSMEYLRISASNLFMIVSRIFLSWKIAENTKIGATAIVRASNEVKSRLYRNRYNS